MPVQPTSSSVKAIHSLQYQARSAVAYGTLSSSVISIKPSSHAICLPTRDAPILPLSQEMKDAQ